MINKIRPYLGFYIFIFTVILSWQSCQNRPGNILNQDDMVKFLTDLHKLEGSLTIKSYTSPDSIVDQDYYNALFKKYGITQADFDSSLVWYVHNPKKFTKIYGKVVENLTQFEKDVNDRKFHPIDSVALRSSKIDIWNGEKKYIVNKDSAKTLIEYRIDNQQLQWADIYTLSFIMRVSAPDSIVNNSIVMHINYADRPSDSIVAKVYPDSLLRRYKLKLVARYQDSIVSITGLMLKNNSSKVKMLAIIDSIKLIRHYDQLAQDSILKVINKVRHPDTTKIKLLDPVKSIEPVKIRVRSKVIVSKDEKSK